MSDLDQRLRAMPSSLNDALRTMEEEAADEIDCLRERCAGIEKENEDWRGRALQQQTLYIEANCEIDRLRAELANVIDRNHISKALGAVYGAQEAAAIRSKIAYAMNVYPAVTDEQQKPMPKGPAGDAGQVGWMGGEFDR